MAMNVGNPDKEDEPMMEINTTPLIDVMLVLLVMLIITIPIQTHAVKLNMPVGNPPPPLTPPEVVTVDIDFDGTITWNTELIPDRNALERHLVAASREPTQPELHIRPNRLATYRYVAEVMATAQRLGVSKIGLVGNEQFLNN